MSENYNILLIEDESEICEQVAQYLQESEWRVSFAKSANEALAKCRNQEFDCILTDINLEKSSGIRVIEFLRERTREVNHKTPIIVISAYVSRDILMMVQFKVSWIFVKPFKLSDVKTKMVEAIEKYKASL